MILLPLPCCVVAWISVWSVIQPNTKDWIIPSDYLPLIHPQKHRIRLKIIRLEKLNWIDASKDFSDLTSTGMLISKYLKRANDISGIFSLFQSFAYQSFLTTLEMYLWATFFVFCFRIWILVLLCLIADLFSYLHINLIKYWKQFLKILKKIDIYLRYYFFLKRLTADNKFWYTHTSNQSSANLIRIQKLKPNA